MARYSIRNLDYYCDDVYHKNTDDILYDLKADFDKLNNPAKVLRFLDDFVSWCAKEHPNITIKTHPNDKGKPMRAKNPKTTKNYFLNVRKYLKLCPSLSSSSANVSYDVILASKSVLAKHYTAYSEESLREQYDKVEDYLTLNK